MKPRTLALFAVSAGALAVAGLMTGVLRPPLVNRDSRPAWDRLPARDDSEGAPRSQGSLMDCIVED